MCVRVCVCVWALVCSCVCVCPSSISLQGSTWVFTPCKAALSQRGRRFVLLPVKPNAISEERLHFSVKLKMRSCFFLVLAKRHDGNSDKTLTLFEYFWLFIFVLLVQALITSPKSPNHLNHCDDYYNVTEYKCVISNSHVFCVVWVIYCAVLRFS